METTALVDTGIYAIVRHPQGGTAGILLNLALAFIGQHWLLVILGAVGMALLVVLAGEARAEAADREVARVHFERGVALSRAGQAILDQAEQRIEVLLSDGSTEPNEFSDSCSSSTLPVSASAICLT